VQAWKLSSTKKRTGFVKPSVKGDKPIRHPEKFISNIQFRNDVQKNFCVVILAHSWTRHGIAIGLGYCIESLEFSETSLRHIPSGEASKLSF